MNGKAVSTKMFEYLELRSSVLLAEINHLLTEMRVEKGSGRAWRVICDELKAKQQDLYKVFDSIRVEIEVASIELAVKEIMIKHLDDSFDITVKDSALG